MRGANVWRPLRLSFVAGLLGFVLCGCPVPIPPQGHVGVHGNIPDRPSDLVVAGKTTRADVLLLLGSPDSQSPDGRRFEYHSELHQGGVIFVIAAGGQAAGLGPEAFLERRLIIGFDGKGVVDTVESDEKSCTRVAGFGGNAAGRSEPCLRVSDGGAIALLPGPAERYHAPRPTDVSFDGAWWSPACQASGGNRATRYIFDGAVIVTDDALILTGARLGEKVFGRGEPVTLRMALGDIGELVRATHSELYAEPLWVQARDGGCVEVDLSKSTYLGLGRADRRQTERLTQLLESRLDKVARRP